jgi:arylformamidase
VTAAGRGLIDVTRRLTPGHPTWSGDPPFELRQVSSIAEGDSVNVLRLETSTHVGTHLDAPWHYDDGGDRLDGVPLDVLIGPCLVVEAPGSGPVGAADVVAAVRRAVRDEAPPQRLLLRTGESDHWERFPDPFRPLTVELVDALADLGVRLVGTDAPSVDAADSKELPVHAAFARRGVFIVEGLALAAVRPGAFELICLPLRLGDADASPVRALLRSLG